MGFYLKHSNLGTNLQWNPETGSSVTGCSVTGCSVTGLFMIHGRIFCSKVLCF